MITTKSSTLYPYKRGAHSQFRPAGYFLTRIPELAAEVGIPPERVINLHPALGGTGVNEPEKYTMPELFVDNW